VVVDTKAAGIKIKVEGDALPTIWGNGMHSQKKLKSIYRASFNAKIAKTISLAHLGPEAESIFRASLPKPFHSDQPFAVKAFLSRCSTANKLSVEPSLTPIKRHYADRARDLGVNLSDCKNYEEVAQMLGIAKMKILSTPGCMDLTREQHYKVWLKKLYQDLFPIKTRAKKLSEQLYRVKHEFLEAETPVCLHRLPSGEVRRYYEVQGWGFHGDICTSDSTGLKIKDIPDFEHLNLRPVLEAYTKDPWEDVFDIIGWERREALGEQFFLAAHDDFQSWLSTQNQAS
jgi:hypothetical protein